MGKKKPILRNMGGCLKGCVPATVLSPVTISLEALMEVFIPILMATIVDGGLYRAAVSDPPVLILDEATSSVDTRTEMLIERGDHQALLEQKGRYYQLYTGMFELN